MQIKYTGHSQKMSVLHPVGCSKSGAKSVTHFFPGEIHEMSDEDGAKLLQLNAGNENFAQVGGAAETPKAVGRPKKVAE